MDKNNSERRRRTRDFIAYWTGKGYEKGESQKFWLSLLTLLDVENPEKFISFEEQVHLDHTAFIDGFIPATHVLIEQKSLGKDLRAPIRQSDGTLLTPFRQAKRYSAELPYSERPRWIVTCNFAEFLVYDMERPDGEPASVLLKDLEKELYRLNFLVHTQDAALQREMEISLAAGELVGRLYDALLARYIDPTSPQTLHSLNALCVRLVFCLYAEDAGLFPSHTAFHDYLASFNPDNVRDALIKLFRMLDTKPEERDPYERPDLLAFPYVNGGLFRDESIEIPRFTPEILRLILNDCSADFDWSGISPTIFGAVFESTLNPETRRSGGMHYTSIENIHKVIDPLFLDELTDSFASIAKIPQPRKRNAALLAFQDRLASLTFLDPACGSGNFLTETFLSLRRLENRVLKLLRGDSRQLAMGGGFSPIKVSISQFYGIEINDFAATVAKTALWIAESQMMRETEDIVGRDLDFLPLKTYTNITEGNALRLDWETVVPKDTLNYIMGNPPFVGYSLQSKEQKDDILSLYVDERGKPYKTAGKIDYVAGWYMKAAQLIQGTSIKATFVSTNSITQGEQVAGMWKPLFNRFGIHIDFAYRTFRWDSEAKLKAHVHCVIVGFSWQNHGARTFLSSTSGGSEEANGKNAVAPYASSFQFFDRAAGVKTTQGVNLPHWQQHGTLQFITFRLADSMPQGVLDEMKREKDEWLKRHPKPWDGATEAEYHERFTNEIDQWLDAGHGSCLLRDPQAAATIEECLRRFDGVRYHLVAYVVMPNHMHVLAQFLQGFDAARIVKAWKGTSAHKINKALGQTGELWQKDYFDRIVRSDAHLAHIVHYIRHNYSQGGVALLDKSHGESYETHGASHGARTFLSSSSGSGEEVNGRNAVAPYGARTFLSSASGEEEKVNGKNAVAPYPRPVIFDGRDKKQAHHINAYLIDAPDIFVESRNNAICDVPPMVYGNKPVDGGFLFLTPEERKEALAKEPQSAKFIHRIYGSEEYINNKQRYCYWLVGASPAEIRACPMLRKRVEGVRAMRLASTKAATRQSADTPTLFQEIRQPDTNYVIVPRVSSERRRYVPIGFLSPEIIVNDSVQIIPNATLYHFGVLTSNVHMAWMRAVCGRLEMRYRYSKDIVYNNFPWPGCGARHGELYGARTFLSSSSGGEDTDNGIPAVAPYGISDEQREKIEQTAQAILDARALYPDSSLADLYDETLMPPELRKAHQANDRAVMAAYGFPRDMDEPKIVAELMRMYQKLTES